MDYSMMDHAWEQISTHPCTYTELRLIDPRIIDPPLNRAKKRWSRNFILYKYRKVGLFRNFGGKCATLYLTNYSLEKEKLLIKYPCFPKLRTPIKVKFPSQPCRLADIGRCIFTRRLRNNPTLRYTLIS